MKLPSKAKMWDRTKHYAGVMWAVPAVKSIALTWLIRFGVPSGIAGIIVAITDGLNGGV
jgi:hypothetical protein